MTEKADAKEEAEVQAEGADQDNVTDPEFDAGFEDEANDRPKVDTDPDGALKLEPDKPATPAGDRPRGPDGKFLPADAKPEGDKPAGTPAQDAAPAPQTAAEKVEAAAKALDAKPAGDVPPKAVEPAGDILDALPTEYGWAREVRENGKLAAFLASQPKTVQKASQSGDPDDAMFVLDLYLKAQQPAPVATASEKRAMLAILGDTKFTAPDGTERTLKEIAEEYQNSELLEAIFAGVKAMQGSGGQGQPAKPDTAATDKLQQRLDAMKAEQDFWEPVLEAHSDAKRLWRSGKIKEWVEAKGTDGMKRLYRSPEPDNAILVFDAYKEAMAQEAAAPKVDAAGKAKKDIDGLHGESLKGRREVKTPATKEGGGDRPEDFDDGFEKGAK